MTNTQLQAITALLLLAHLGALLWAILRKDIRPAVWLNLGVAIAVWLYWIPRFAHVDSNGAALLAFELVTAATSIAVLRGIRVLRFLMWALFALHACAAVLAVVFAFTFAITRLF